ncbi:MAG: sigma-70 family RNA polymerase sigma factor [Pseudomonadota bacterium]|nr:sigma-70 family RNA polymerase sigma factor [Pseudomonadota bacterium]
MIPDDDAGLVARCRRGDASGWEAIVRRYQRLVFTVARRAGLDEHAAADVFQTVFARLIESLPRIQDPGRLQAWLVTTAKREAFLQVSRGRRTVSFTPGEDLDGSGEWDPPDESPLPEDVLAELQQLDLLRAGLEQLDERCRQLLRMLFSDDAQPKSYDEVARELGMEVGSIGPTRARCLAKLRRLVS